MAGLVRFRPTFLWPVPGPTRLSSMRWPSVQRWPVSNDGPGPSVDEATRFKNKKRKSRMASSRGAWLVGIASLTLLQLAAGASWAQSASQTRLSFLAVDVDQLAVQGLGTRADLIQSALSAELKRAFADRSGGDRSLLLVRITGASFGSYAGSGSGSGAGGRGGSESDYLEGEALIVGPRGEVLTRVSQISTLPSSYGGAWYDPASEERRLVVISQHFARWLRRRL